jgi:hypothetical protein
MKLNRGGLILSAIYAAISVPLILLAYTNSDFKGAYILAQLANVPAGMLFTYLGAVPFVMRHPWLNNIPVFFLINLALCYLIGWICSRLARR